MGVKTIEGHYTGHFKSVVTKPQNVFVMRDIACSGYVAGGNTLFFGKDENGTGAFGDATKVRTDTQNNIAARLSFANEVVDKYASLLAFPCSGSQLDTKMDTVLTVTSRLLPWDVRNGGSNHDSFPGGQAMYEKYKTAFSLDQVHYGEDSRAAENMEFISQGSVNNAACFVGPHRKYNGITKSFMDLTPGQGHFGPDAIPGDARWRRGESVSLKSARDTMVSLELASHAQMVFQRRA